MLSQGMPELYNPESAEAPANDGGIGMLKALGSSFSTVGNDVGEGAQALSSCCHQQLKIRKLAECTFQVACDVTNPLCGRAAQPYHHGRSKGVTRTKDAWIRQ